jgi:FkbM family methyltransferase
MTINHKLLIENAVAFRDKLPANKIFEINELFKMPKFFDWVECYPTDISNFKMYLAGGDDGVALRFFWNGMYEKFTIKLWCYFALRGGVIIDIGAHTGAYSLSAYSVDPKAKIISFEPHFMNFARLNMNLRGNNFSTSGILMLGVGEKNEIQPFSISTSLSYLSTGGSVGKRSNSIVQDVKIVSLDQYLPENIKDQIKLLKIDVEGHEAPCLRGMINLIEKCRPVIFLECISSVSGIEVTSLLRKLDYLFFIIDDVTGEISPVDDISPEFDTNGKLVMSRLNRIGIPSKDLISYFKSFPNGRAR